MKPDEQRFLIDLYRASLEVEPKHAFGVYCGMQPKLRPRDIINGDNFYMHYKRAWYLLEKWTNKGWYSYGVTLDLGWLEPKGIEKAKELLLSSRA